MTNPLALVVDDEPDICELLAITLERMNITTETWNDWIGQGTKVINELRLDFSREEDQDTFEQQMCEFLGIDEALHKKLTGTS